ncbi:pilin [Cryptosporangium sp. NPDC048952]|uniref:pilin n=1 Tax=Cryptosporangium sp. NPDC048952 TaxID=3363961 RepID=UPI003711062F
MLIAKYWRRGHHRRPLFWNRSCRGRVLAAVVVTVAGVLLVVLVGFADAAMGAESPSAVAPPTTSTADLDDVINRLWVLLTGLLVGYAGLMLAWGAVRRIGADGDPGEIDRANRTMRGALIGLALGILAPMLVAEIAKVFL